MDAHKLRTAGIPPVADLVPHTATMLLLDRVVAVGEDTLQAEVRITPQTLFAGPDGVGSWIGIEYMAQAVAACAGYRRYREGCAETVKIGFLLGSRRYTASRDRFPLGSTLHIHVQQLLQAENGLGSFECFIDDGAQRVASATLTVFQPNDPQAFFNEGSV
ncbi:MAG: beta-ketoacyl-ACP synthase [Herbaspirillum sp.]|jgi:3-oxoacyl-[acyl-carrier-protein] synthase-1|nr:beta-ketoacyl-ACP synthase [Herbaspirillum sp.]